MQTLYQIQMPFELLADVDTLYVRGEKFNIEQDALIIYKGGKVWFNTYYNMFSLEKWRTYTNLQSLCLKLILSGNVVIQIRKRRLTAGDYLESCLATYTFKDKEKQEKIIDLSNYMDDEGLLYFTITSLDADAKLYQASYETKENFTVAELATVICTYKRETYIERFKNMFEQFDNHHLHAFIIDNGRTLQPIKTEKLSIIPNKNFGGAGGFTRGMLEVVDYNKCHSDKKLDYITFMDDDILIDFRVFERLLSFLSLRKEKYNNYFVAGAMCSLDYPFMQYERYSSWRGDSFIQASPNYDLRDLNSIVTNEREEKLNKCSAGWWFSTFSTQMITPNNYPFPCFFRGDDMEFTIRNGAHIITLNGVNVWHEPFYKKYSIVSEKYYLLRNTMVINALYYPQMSYKQYIKRIKKDFIKALITYDYDCAELILKACEDFKKGVSFFEEVNPEELNSELMKKNHKKVSLQEAVDEYRFDDINYELYFKTDKGIRCLLRRLTLNGFLIPKIVYKSFGYALEGFGTKYISYYKTRQVFVLDPFTRKGYYVKPNKKKAITLICKFGKMSRLLKRNFDKIVSEYQSEFYVLQTEKFWRKYLEIETDKYEVQYAE